ncbi:LysE family translocator [Cellulomonas rhizosphaerae]|uniref:LysE family translocator n=1 Tax=Cellulomonas rhizosphaerae TaxID=2293719 RepID=A0A413RI09_9CELL|nr:LysE family translocator [Cellulomonas rhizosphaerae]RHA37897.1 LysE family translocator [Cellulomonas rhizosphaerae]
MTVPHALASFALVAALMTIVPGLDTAYVLRTAISRRRGHAHAAALGITAGCLAWGVAAAVGASALLTASEVAFRALTLAGAAYLVLLGAQMIRASLRPHPEVALDGEPPTGSSAWRTFAAGLGTNLLSPKIGVFYLATIPLFIPDGVPPPAMGVALAVVHNVIGIAWFTLIVVATGWAGSWLRRPRIARVTDRVTGGALVLVGVRLAAGAR